jgi:carboxymethylenebutenolidase
MIRYIANQTRPLFAMLCGIVLAAACNPNSSGSTVGGAASSSQGGAQSPDSGGEVIQHAVITDMLAYGEVDDQNVKGHFAFPEDKVGASPAIVLVHEWWGLNDDVRLLANQFAAEGFIVLAVDMFGGQTATAPGDARKLMLEVFENPEFAEENLQQARDWVLNIAGASQVAVVGYGFGGDWSLNAAIAMPDQFDAAVIFYGRVSENEQVLAGIQIPVLGFFGGADNIIPVESVKQFDIVLEKLGKDHEINIYPGAKSGFANPTSRHYYQNIAGISWRRMIEFLNQNLNSAQPGPA